MNGARYFVGVGAGGGAARHGNAGANDGIGRCDAQCAHGLGWVNVEANVEDSAPSGNDEDARAGNWSQTSPPSITINISEGLLPEFQIQHGHGLASQIP